MKPCSNPDVPLGFVISLTSAAMSFSLYSYFKHINDLDQFGVNYAYQNLVLFCLFLASLVTSLCVSIHRIPHGKKDHNKKECPYIMMARGIDLPLLVFDETYDPSKFEPITNKPFDNKPNGGLWTSPFIPDKGSEWIEWCKEENFGMGGKGSPMSILKVKDDGKFLLINTLKDLIEALKAFQLKTYQSKLLGRSSFLNDPVLDYESLARCVDGVYLTKAGQGATRLSGIEDVSRASLYGWDCETVLIMNQNVIDNVFPGKIEAKWVDKTGDNVENFE
jgi:hypothetical protein